MLVSKALELFLSRPNLSLNTRELYRSQVGMFVRVVGDKPIEEIRQADLMFYVADRQALGKSPRSLNVLTYCFKAFFSWLFRNEHLESNPAIRLESVKVEPLSDDERAISIGDWQKLRDYVRQNSVRNYAILAFLMDSACRVSAAASLRFADLDIANLRAIVYEAKIRSRVEVAFGVECANALRVWLEQRPSVEHDFVFTSTLLPFSRLTPGAIREMMKRACVSVGIQVRTPHTLRHAALQHLAKQPDVTLLDVQTKANHKSPKTTLNNYYPRKSERVFELSRRYSLVDENKTPNSPITLEHPPLRILPKRSS